MKGHPPQVGIEQPPQGQALRLAGAQPLLLEPQRTLADARHQVEDGDGRKHAGPQHQAPRPVRVVVDQRVAELIDERRQQEPSRIAALQDAGGDAAMLRRPLFQGQRHAGRPHPAHADAKQAPEREQHHVARRHPAQERKGRVPRDREQDRALPAIPIGVGACANAADHAEQQRHGRERAGKRQVDLEAATDVGKNEGDDGEVKRVERPRGKRGEKRFPLLTADFSVPRLGHGKNCSVTLVRDRLLCW